MREQVYSILTVDDDVTIYDSRSLNWAEFPFDNGFTIHTLTQEEIYRPYLVCAQYYSVLDYEDIILMINNIEDIFEVVPGTQIKIPNELELKNFILANRK